METEIILKPIETLSLQTVFDKIYIKFILENTDKSITADDNLCLYSKDINGVGCFFGYIFSDYFDEEKIEEFDNGWKGGNIRTLIEKYHDVEQLFKGTAHYNLSNLQYIHDNVEKEEWQDRLNYFANFNNLTIPELKKKTENI